MSQCFAMLLLLYTISFFIACAYTRMLDRNLPIIADDEREFVRNTMISSCVMGNTTYEIGTTWSPVLSHVGRLNCMKCLCEAVKEKNRIYAKSRCYDIGHTCPKLNCARPVLLKNTCCKVCRSVKKPKENQVTKNANKKSSVFTALLHNTDSSYIFASGRFELVGKDFSYSIFINHNARPDRVLFMNDSIIIEEFPVADVDYQSENGKICGIWSKMSRIYRRLIRLGYLEVALAVKTKKTFPKDLHVIANGRIIRALKNEMYSTLVVQTIESRVNFDSAVVGISSSEHDDYFTIHIIFHTNRADLPEIQILSLQIESLDQNLIRHEISAERIPGDHSLYVSLKNIYLSPELQKQILNGNATLSFMDLRSPSYSSFFNRLMPRHQCDYYTALITPSSSRGVLRYSGAGIGVFYVTNTGSLTYVVKFQDLNSTILSLYLHEKGQKDIDFKNELLSNFVMNRANGTIQVLEPYEYKALLQNQMLLSVDTEYTDLAYSGHLMLSNIISADDIELPLLLADSNYENVGFLRVNIDERCNLNYFAKFRESTLKPQMRLDMIVSFREFRKRRLIKWVSKPEIRGVKYNIGLPELARMSRTETLFIVTFSKNGRMESKPYQMFVPKKCLSSVSKPFADKFNQQDQNDILKKMIDEEYCALRKSVSSLGYYWMSEEKNCTVCRCLRKELFCEPFMCYSLECERQIYVEGFCCPICSDKADTHGSEIRNISRAETRYCHFDKLAYPVGTFWYPYMLPNGFNRCVHCHCTIVDGQAQSSCKSERCEQCPGLEIEPQRDQCCHSCPPKNNTSNNIGLTSKARENDGNVSSITPRSVSTTTFLKTSTMSSCRNGRAIVKHSESYTKSFPGLEIHCLCLNGYTKCRLKK